jgi:5-methyltetrahydropteroyltriglutamate--homocysteine methyltransferase
MATDRVNIVSLDFTRGDNMSLIKKFGFPASKILGVGVIDGRSVWKLMPSKVIDILKDLGTANIRIQPSSSLQFVPWTLECESELLEHTAGSVLSFSKQKLAEVVAVAHNDETFLKDAENKWTAYTMALASDKTVANRVNALVETDFTRSASFTIRSKQQLPGLPILPTTTIGSFPQTKEIRSLRNQFKRNKITQPEYEAKIDQQIAFMVGIQEVRFFLSLWMQFFVSLLKCVYVPLFRP